MCLADPHRRWQFILTRTVLRMLIGAYFELPASKIRFQQGSSGKPKIDVCHSVPLQFNISHSGAFAAFAFSWSHSVGVDIEQRRPLPYIRSLEKLALSKRELENVQYLGPTERGIAFWHVWTRKEALFKTEDRSLNKNLNGTEVLTDRKQLQAILSTGAAAQRIRKCIVASWNFTPQCTPRYLARFRLVNCRCASLL